MRFLSIIVLIAATSTGISQSLSKSIGFKQGFLGLTTYGIIKDSKGFMWFGCSDGLWRWDGYTFTVYHQNSENTNSLSDNFIRCLYLDQNGDIWIGTLSGGLNRLNPATNTFTHYQHNDQDSTSILNNEILDINGDKLGNLWVSTAKGIDKINLKTEQIIHFVHRDNNEKTLGQELTPAVFPDGEGMIWVGLGGSGFDQLNPNTLEVKHHFITHPDKTINFRANVVRKITEDDQGNLWVGTFAGLIRFNKKSGEMKHWLHDDGDSTSLSHNSIWDVIASENKVWVSTWGGGISCLDISTGKFENKAFEKDGVYGMSNRQLPSIYKDENGSIWVGTNGEGIIKIPPVAGLHLIPNAGSLAQAGSFTVFKGKSLTYFCADEGSVFGYSYPRGIEFILKTQSADAKVKLRGNRVMQVVEDSLGNAWIGTDNGLTYYDTHTGKTRYFRNDPNDPSSLGSNQIVSLALDSSGELWIATSLGLDLMEASSHTFKHYRSNKNDPNSLSGNGLFSVKENEYGLWVGTYSTGLNLFDPKNQTFKRFQAVDSDPNSLNSNLVGRPFVDSRRIMWVVTGSGFSRYYPESGKFVNFEFRHGIPHGQVSAISEDRNKNLIVTAHSGIGRLSADDIVKETKPYEGIIHRIPSFLETQDLGITISVPDNHIYFISGSKLYNILVDSLARHSEPSPIAITNFQLDPNNNHPLDSIEKMKSTAYRKTINLTYDQNLFSIEFAALDFVDSKYDQYAYKLEGFDKDWKYSGPRRYTTYTNLDPGTYVFKAKGANDDEVWSEGATFEIIISPPFWKTWWAYSVYGVAFLGLLTISRRAVANRERLKAQMALEQKEKQNLQELDQLKTKFFSNITHEFRTPLTLIKGPAQELSEKSNDPEDKKLLYLIRSNADRLLKLINQLLDLSKLDAKEMKLINKKINLNSFLKTFISQFNSLASAKQIDFSLQLPDNLPSVLADEEKLETIITNLISNAIKFTPRSGKVKVIVIMNQNFEFIVTDTGKGIPPDKLKDIFDRFYQVSPTDSSHAEGTGIGLALIKEYVELMKGIIHVESQVGIGTTMKVSLPLEIVNTVAESVVEEVQFITRNTTRTDENGTLPIVLIVEDNQDIREFIKSCLGNEYSFAEAQHGIDGLEVARQRIPDLIISDLMMPEMDGLTFCREIKKDRRTDHIPFIMLTAKAEEEDKIQGLRTGADDYLVKPFNKTELGLKVQNLIQLRMNLQSNIKNRLLSQGSTIVATSPEEQFILKAKNYIELNMSSGGLTVESLAAELGLSREQCYRKIIALTSLSPSALIRKLRLQKATQLLNAKWGTISQVAYEVGFENLSHFSKAFKEEYGKVPSEYAP